MRRKPLIFGSIIAFALTLFAFALIHERESSERKVGILDLYEKLQMGMSRQRAEEILGSPVMAPLEGPGEDVRIYYLDQKFAERSLLPHESPIAPAGIVVTFRSGKLVEKSYNSQWIKQNSRPWWRFWR